MAEFDDIHGPDENGKKKRKRQRWGMRCEGEGGAWREEVGDRLGSRLPSLGKPSKTALSARAHAHEQIARFARPLACLLTTKYS